MSNAIAAIAVVISTVLRRRLARRWGQVCVLLTRPDRTMGAMTSTSQQTSRSHGRGMLLLVLAVLAGIWAMHGLAPGGAPAAHTGSQHRHATAMAEGAAAHLPGEDCAHATGDGTAGHMNHADATCAAGGIGTSYAPPALAASLDTVPSAVTPVSMAVALAESGRAPPDLAQLQLLRI